MISSPQSTEANISTKTWSKNSLIRHLRTIDKTSISPYCLKLQVINSKQRTMSGCRLQGDTRMSIRCQKSQERACHIIVFLVVSKAISGVLLCPSQQDRVKLKWRNPHLNVRRIQTRSSVLILKLQQMILKTVKRIPKLKFWGNQQNQHINLYNMFLMEALLKMM